MTRLRAYLVVGSVALALLAAAALGGVLFWWLGWEPEAGAIFGAFAWFFVFILVLASEEYYSERRPPQPRGDHTRR